MEYNTDQKRVWVFFLLAYVVTWGVSALVTYVAVSPLVKGLGSLLLHYGPALAAIFLAWRLEGGAGLRNLFSGLGRWRVGIQWYLFIFLFPLGVRSLAAVGNVLLGGAWPLFFNSPDVPVGNPLLLIIPIFLVVLLQAGIAEEIGWRGYALPRLQTRYTALVSSLILGVVWTFWHYHPQNLPSLVKLGPWFFMAVLPLTLLMTWVYNNTDNSLLLLVLFHTASNVSDWIVPINPSLTSTGTIQAFIINVVLLWIVALIILVRYGPEDLMIKADV